MRHVDDAIDLATTVVLMVCMLTMCVWCQAYLRSLQATPVFEKTAPLVQFDKLEEHVYSAKDLLLGLVVGDELRPDPGIVNLYDEAGHTYTINFNAAWFGDKEGSINAAWNGFFKDCINCNSSTWTLRYTNGVPTHWDILVHNV